MLFTKLSILQQLMRFLCPHRSGWVHGMIWSLIILNAVFYAAISIPTFWACNPRSKIWRPYEDGTCVNLAAMLLANAAVNMISDISILILPVYKIWQLQLSIRKKIGVSSVFSAGLL